MGYWGLKSYENDDAHDALDGAFERVHGDLYDELTDDANPLTLDQVHQRLANAETLAAALDLFEVEAGSDRTLWDELDHLGYAGIVVRHAELGVAIPDDVRSTALEFLETEEIEWDDPAQRNRLREREIALLKAGKAG